MENDNDILKILNGKRHLNRFTALLYNNEIGRFLIPDINIAIKNQHRLLNKNLRLFILNDGKDDIGITIVNLWPIVKIACVDIGFLKKHRGKKVYKFVKEHFAKFREKNKGYSYIAKIKEENRSSLFFSLKMGFKLIGTNEKKEYLLRYE